MFVLVIPTTHSIGISPLTYKIPLELDGNIFIGSLVEVPVGKFIEYGIVTSILYEQTDVIGELKSIIRIISEKQILAPYQISLIFSLSARYLIPIHRVLGFFLIRPVLKRLESKKFPIDDIISNKQLLQKNHIRVSQKTFIDIEMLDNFTIPMSVIICPDDWTVLRYKNELTKIPDDTIFLLSDATDTTRAQAWIDIANGKYTRIFGTRRLLYYNLSRYQHIIYLEDAFAREYFHFPTRIHYLDVLSMIYQSEQFSIDIITSTPTLKMLSMFHNFSYQSII